MIKTRNHNHNLALHIGSDHKRKPAASALHLPQTISKSALAKLPRIHQTLLRQIDVLHVGRILGRSTADTRGNEHRISLENDSIVDDLVNSEGNKVVVLDDSALVGGTPVKTI